MRKLVLRSWGGGNESRDSKHGVCELGEQLEFPFPPPPSIPVRKRRPKKSHGLTFSMYQESVNNERNKHK